MSFRTFEQYTKVPSDLLQANLSALETIIGSDFDSRIDELRCERYLDNTIPSLAKSPNWASVVRSAYYRIRPLLPVSVRKHLQRIALRGWRNIGFPSWPVDTTVDDKMREAWHALFDATGDDPIPFIWFWPDGRSYAAMMTHDVETASGRDNCSRLMALERQFGIHSSFEVVPEKRYDVPEEFLAAIRAGGCEVCMHGLNHDGHLFAERGEFLRRAHLIDGYMSRFGATGFRSPVMYRRPDWIAELKISYDMSFPNVAHLDPQRGGCCTVMPFFLGDVLELPLTTTQDYPLQNILQEWSIDLWRKQDEIVSSYNGLLSFIIHPDYCVEPRAVDLYRELLGFLAERRDSGAMWLALPGEIDTWWRRRDAMKLRRVAGGWQIDGEASDRARIAWASRRGGRIQVTLAGIAEYR